MPAEPSLPKLVRVAGTSLRPAFKDNCTPASVTFGIHSAESLSEGLEREIDDQIQVALDDLSKTTDLGQAAHGARRTVKRARALLKLGRPSLASDVYSRGNRTMRDAGRCVAPVRDADVLVETARSVRGRAHSGQILSALERDRDRVFATALGADRSVARAESLLRSVSITWPEPGDGDDCGLLRAGLARTYDSVRAHAALAFNEGAGAKAYHELRKRAKDLRHQLEFFTPTAPEVLEPIAEELHDLTDMLGDANDLVVLARYVDSARGISEAQRSGLLSHLNVRGRALWREARSLGPRLFAEETGDFVGRVEECWVKRRP